MVIVKSKRGDISTYNGVIKTNKKEEEVKNEFIEKVNRDGFFFQDVSKQDKISRMYWFDIIDNKIKIYGEIKVKDCNEGSGQLLHGVGKSIDKCGLLPARYLLLVDNDWSYFYDFPDKEIILNFYKKYETFSPSDLNKKTTKEALEILGEAFVFCWRTEKINIRKIDNDEKGFYLNDSNIKVFFRLLSYYGILAARMIEFLFLKQDTGNKLKIVNNKIKLGNVKSIEANRPIKDIHKFILTNINIGKPFNLDEQLEKMGFKGIDAIKQGSYHTMYKLGDEIASIINKYIKPTFLLEPFAGVGSLALPFNCDMWLNDIDSGAVNALKSIKKFRKQKITNKDFWNYSTLDSIVSQIPKDREFLILTNPPWNAKGGFNDRKTKGKVSISYGNVSENLKGIYGTKNQLFPSIGRCIEIIKKYNNGYLGIITPFALFCKREGYLKLLNEILYNFEFVYGNVHNGERYFISKNKPVSFSLWKYKKNCNTDLLKIKFETENGKVLFKEKKLIKSHWKYLQSNSYSGEIVAPRNDYFSCPSSKVIGNSIGNGSEMIEKNVKKKLFLKIPDELFYGLWSYFVSGNDNSIIKCNLFFDNAYVHLPDFSKEETFEILTYILLNIFVDKDYTNGLVNIGEHKVIFGKSKLTDGANYLFDNYGYLPIENITISKVIKLLRKGEKISGIQDIIQKEIEIRLEKIGYWDYIPLPEKPTSIDKYMGDKK